MSVGRILDCWGYEVLPGRSVLVVSYGCHPDGVPPEPVLSAEHRQVGMFGLAELSGLALPDGYRRSIALWMAALAAARGD